MLTSFHYAWRKIHLSHAYLFCVNQILNFLLNVFLTLTYPLYPEFYPALSSWCLYLKQREIDSQKNITHLLFNDDQK